MIVHRSDAKIRGQGLLTTVILDVVTVDAKNSLTQGDICGNARSSAPRRQRIVAVRPQPELPRPLCEPRHSAYLRAIGLRRSILHAAGDPTPSGIANRSGPWGNA